MIKEKEKKTNTDTGASVNFTNSTMASPGLYQFFQYWSHK